VVGQHWTSRDVSDAPALAGDPAATRFAPAERCPLGKDCPTFGATQGRRHDPPMDNEDARADAQDRRRLQQDLRQAVIAGGFLLHYQPRVALATRMITGAEAVLRWPHRKRGLIPPDRFVPLAEQNGLIGPIGAWALRTGCAEAAGWPDAHLTLSINVSPRQLQDAAFLTHVATATEQAPISPERIELELTEAMLLAIDDDMLFMLSALRDMGVGLALDDFGTGYASLAMLRRIPLTRLKIDRSLVRDLPANVEDAAIVRAVVATTHATGLTVTAEGVETEAQCDFLVQAGTDDGQGFLFGRPVPAERFLAQLVD
jgi:EAL domain-containing protein (putative c-di-GMP-specific phosphodiesterase class I)